MSDALNPHNRLSPSLESMRAIAVGGISLAPLFFGDIKKTIVYGGSGFLGGGIVAILCKNDYIVVRLAVCAGVFRALKAQYHGERNLAILLSAEIASLNGVIISCPVMRQFLDLVRTISCKVFGNCLDKASQLALTADKSRGAMQLKSIPTLAAAILTMGLIQSVIDKYQPISQEMDSLYRRMLLVVAACIVMAGLNTFLECPDANPLIEAIISVAFVTFNLR